MGLNLKARNKNPYARALDAKLFGLALSGGGIRSATFSLGILEKLAELGLLAKIDYLSTVSGGGFIGGWLTSWIQRASLPVVETNMRTGINPVSDEARPTRFLREYSQYLAPEAGLLTADSWTMASIFLRNLILNQVIIVLSLGALLALPLSLIGLIALARQDEKVAIACLCSGAVAALLACFNIGNAVIDRGLNGAWGQSRVVSQIVAPLLFSCLLLVAGAWGIELHFANLFVAGPWKFVIPGIVFLCVRVPRCCYRCASTSTSFPCITSTATVWFELSLELPEKEACAGPIPLPDLTNAMICPCARSKPPTITSAPCPF